MANKGLMEMLKNAKQVMDKVDNNNYEKGNLDPRGFTAEGAKQMIDEGVISPQPQTSTQNMGVSNHKIVNGKGVYKNGDKSKLPDVIKKAMIENPIPQLVTPNHTFTLDDVSPLVENSPKPRQIQKSIKTSEMVGMSESQVRGIVQDEIIEFFAKYFTKTLTEDVQKKVIKEMLKSKKR